MRILNIVKYYEPSQGGMESVVKNLVEGIIEISKESNFTIYSNNHFSSIAKEVKKKDGITVIKVATPFHLKSQPLNFRYSLLKKLIKDNDVIHHHYPFPNMEIALLCNLKKIKNKKFVITWHANIKNSRWSRIERLYNPIIKKLLDRADVIVVTSPQLFEASDLLKLYSNKIKIVPLSFDPKCRLLIGKKYPENRDFKLLFVGKLRKYKGVKYLVEAVRFLPVELIIVGSGEEYVNLKEQVKRLNIQDKVNFVSNINGDELSDIYCESDLFVLPSINEAEAFGIVQLEAMANGLPVINTNLKSGVPYVSLNDYTGLTVDPKDVEALRSAIEKIINNKQLYEFFSSNCIERIKVFTRRKMSEAYLNLYNA